MLLRLVHLDITHLEPSSQVELRLRLRGVRMKRRLRMGLMSHARRRRDPHRPQTPRPLNRRPRDFLPTQHLLLVLVLCTHPPKTPAKSVPHLRIQNPQPPHIRIRHVLLPRRLHNRQRHDPPPRFRRGRHPREVRL